MIPGYRRGPAKTPNPDLVETRPYVEPSLHDVLNALHELAVSLERIETKLKPRR